MSFDKLYFGTAGIPLSTKKPSTATGVSRVRTLGLDAMELEFVHSVNLSPQRAAEVKAVASDEKVFLTCHAPYFVNLNAVESYKIRSSVQNILDAAVAANNAGAVSVTFHAGFYLKDSHELVFAKIRKQMENILEELKGRGNKITLRPETTGKGSQFGSLEELLSLCSQLDNCLPCIDFAHIHARSGGKMNSLEEFRAELAGCEKVLGKEFLKNLHCHVAGIAYTEKGERNHLDLKDSDLKYKELLQALKEFDCHGIIISESPNIEGDALLMKKTFEGL